MRVPGTHTLEGVPIRCSSPDRSFRGGEALDGPPLGLRARGQTTTRADEIGRVAMYNAFYKTFMSVRARLARAREEDEDARDGGRDDGDARVGMTRTCDESRDARCGAREGRRLGFESVRFDSFRETDERRTRFARDR